MALCKTPGIVIKQVNYGESDKILTIFTKKYGKIQAMAKGARKTKNPLLACTQLFCYSDFMYYQGKTMAHLNQCELREAFYPLRMDLEKLTYSSYIIELMNAAVPEHQREEKLFSLLVHTLNYIANSKDVNVYLITLAFQIKLMALMGYAPHTSNCVSCGGPLQGNTRMSSKLGGFICGNCYQKDVYSMIISPQGREMLSYILYNPLSCLSQLEWSQDTLQQLQRIMNHYVSTYLEKTFYSLDFLNIIKEKEETFQEGDGING